MSTETRRPDASMSLLTSLIERPLDPGYAAAADRRAAAGLPRATSLRSPLVIGFSLVLGLVLGLASAALQAAETPRVKARATLVAQIEARRAVVAKRTAQVGALQAEALALEEQQLAGRDTAEATRLRVLGQVAGAVPLTGPGLVLTLDDAPSAQQRAAQGGSRTDGTSEDYVMSRDLQILSNALWAAGAEAIAINGQRLTSTSAIRFAGEAILVDYRPLTRPYVVTAIGDPARMPSGFAAGPGGVYLSTLQATFGIVVDSVQKDAVTVPASSTLIVRYAVPDGIPNRPGSATATGTGSATASSSPPTGGTP